MQLSARLFFPEFAHVNICLSELLSIQSQKNLSALKKSRFVSHKVNKKSGIGSDRCDIDRVGTEADLIMPKPRYQERGIARGYAQLQYVGSNRAFELHKNLS